MEIFEFEIPAHTTRREWAVYVIIATCKESSKKILYVGKVGDNRSGCNPIISRIGNHFSHNKIHSQMRNKIKDPINYDYRILYSTFGEYIEESQFNFRDKVNELERKLNTYIQENLKDSNTITFLNPYKGTGVSKKKLNERFELLTEQERESLKKLAQKATEY